MTRVSEELKRGGEWDGVRRDNLAPEVLGSVDVAVLTLKHYSEQRIEGRLRVALVFEEYPVHNMWTGAQGAAALVKGMGTDEIEKMYGRKVPLVLSDVPNPATGEMVTKYVVADPDDWKRLLAEHARRFGERGARKVKKAKGRGR